MKLKMIFAVSTLALSGCMANSDFPSGGAATAFPLTCTGPQCVNLGTAANFVILAKTGIANAGVDATQGPPKTPFKHSTITGDIGVNSWQNTITGFHLQEDPSNTFATSVEVDQTDITDPTATFVVRPQEVFGRIFSTTDVAPTPATLATAVANRDLAYADAAGRTPGTTDVPAGSLSGTLAPGVHRWTTAVTIPTTVTLSGNPTDVWIFQIAGNLTLATSARVILDGGAQRHNIFWQVAGTVSVGTDAHLTGVVLGASSIGLGTKSNCDCQLYPGTSLALDQNTVQAP
jgi:hypothetical protein